MKTTILILLFNLSFWSVNAQLSPKIIDSLNTLEIHIQGQAFEMLNNPDENVRLTSTFFMIKNLIRAFKIDGSFHYPFDSIKSISILTPPDQKFRIFSWHLQLKDGVNRQYGVIQINPEKLSKKQKKNKDLKLWFPLIDRSDSIANPEDTTLGNEFWFGAHYYSIIPFNVKKKTYYMLLGIDDWDKRANRKIIDILSFQKDKPIFGADVFKMKDGKLRNRVIFTYDNDARMTLRWLEDKKMLVFHNLIPKDGESWEMKWNYVPDGSFDFLKFEYGMWKQYLKLQDFYIESN
ncbi:MAG: hypothetical protein HYZ42_07805 [Bacteroidetes bacterium]|nr:hypothetical protein [Bacteroidota bacterium]